MKVYVVNQGEYADRGVCAVFSSKDLADNFVEKYQHLDCYDVQEFEVDDD